MNLYQCSILPIRQIFGQLPHWLDKAQAYAEQKKFDPETLLTARLAPDQWHLGRQIEFLTFTVKTFSTALQGKEMPKAPEGERTYTLATLRAGIDEALTHLKSLTPEQFEGDDNRMIPLWFMPGKGLPASEFANQLAMPNFYFHALTIYSILRHNGVELGKMDYLGQISPRDL